jgi:hypothetical protein
MFHKYITLEELMKRVRAELLADIVGVMGMLAIMDLDAKDSGRKMSFKSSELLERMANIEEQCHDSGLEVSAISARRIVNLLKGCDVVKDKKLEELIDEANKLHSKLLDEMSLVTYLTIEKDKQRYLAENLFGDSVTEAFPSTIIDIEEAGKCLAFERSTACVFHLMRVMESGLRVLGNTLELPASTNRNWETILRKCDDELRKPLDQRSAVWKSDDEFFAGATAMLRSVKDAWRNPTMHIEKVYTEAQAESIWNAVKGFMKHLAAKLKE